MAASVLRDHKVVTKKCDKMCRKRDDCTSLTSWKQIFGTTFLLQKVGVTEINESMHGSFGQIKTLT